MRFEKQVQKNLSVCWALCFSLFLKSFSLSKRKRVGLCPVKPEVLFQVFSVVHVINFLESTVTKMKSSKSSNCSSNGNGNVGESISTCPICNKLADKLCSACRSVSYCSVEHQKQHWKKEHKNNCRIWTVKTSDVMGRYVVAARDIPAGTVLMDEEALAIGPKQETLPVCLGCHKRVDGTYFCSKCWFPLCGKECEKQPIHADNECVIFRRKRAFPKVIDYDKHHPVYECILTIRCLRLKEVNPKKWAKLITMEHHNPLRKEMEGLWNRNEVNVVQFLRNVFKVDEDPMAIHTVVGYSDINSFEIKKDKLTICGMFPDVALMAHECISNTHHSITDDFRMIVRNVIPLKKGDMITTTYTHTLDGTLDRRTHVKHSKLFECLCQRCQDPTEMGTYFSAVKCKACTGGYLIPVDPLKFEPVWGCDNCEHSVPNKSVDMILERIKDEIEEAEQVQSVIELLECVLQKHSGKSVHPNHFLMVSVLHSLSQYYGRVKGWAMSDLSLDSLRRKEEICRKLLKVIDIIEPGLSRIRGATTFELQQAIYFRVQKEYADCMITAEELKIFLQDVLEMLAFSQQVFSFDSPTSMTGRLGKTIPDNIAVVKTVLRKVCQVEID